MRMLPTDISDVTGSTYTYLANGRGPNEGLEYAFKPGERIRLRLINGSAMTFFNVRIPGLPMTVVAADGQDVRPIEVDELQIGVAETYDVVVTPGNAAAYAIIGEAMDRSGFALATLTSAPGVRAALPPRRPPPLLTMADMGMDHGPGNHSMAGMKMRDTSLLPPDVAIGPGIDMVSMNPIDRMADPGIGLDDVGHRVLTYKQLAARTPRPAMRTPTRLLEIHLTGNMERYMWSFDGRKYAAVTDNPIRFAYDERVRVKLINNTMMAHPIHLHGHFFELVNGAAGTEQPLKHTMIVQPGGSAQFDLTADAPGDWAFHCHLLYHMHAGMMQVVTVAAPPVAT
jgi:FtsP/CotA-like multicopper oxidase with cupredoxin domain